MSDPEQQPNAFDAFAAPLAAATAAAIEDAMTRLEQPRLVVVRVSARALPWQVVLLDASYLTSACADELDAPIENALLAVHHSDPGVCELEILAYATSEFQSRIQEILQPTPPAATADLKSRAAAQAERNAAKAAAELSALRLLNGPNGVSPLPVILWTNWRDRLAPTYSPITGARDRRWRWEPTIATAGRGTVEAIWEELRQAATTAPDLPLRLPTSRADLRTLCQSIGLERVAQAIADDARLAIGLYPTTRTDPTDEPAGAITQSTPAQDQPLHLSTTIICDRLPNNIDDRQALPATGTLTIHVELDIAGTASVRIQRHDATPAQSTEPNSSLSVVAALLLTLREPRTAQRTLQMTSVETTIYQRLYDHATTQHRDIAVQLLGHPTPVQDDPRSERAALLFAFYDTDALHIEHLDGGAIYGLASPAAIRNRDWNHVIAESQSG